MWDGTRFFSSKAKMGSLVIAVFLLVFGVWLIECSDLETLNKTIQEAVPELCLERETFKHCREYITTFATVIMAVGLVEGVFEIIVGGLLIYGILKQKKRLIQALLLMLEIQLIFHILCSLGILYTSYDDDDLAQTFFRLRIISLYLFIEACLLLIIRAHYLQVKLSNSEQSNISSGGAATSRDI
ncbi:uncharacterized protein [Procambarus clarkii]|uniref:uncharacterized protein isoform X1 n=1 Tax=Procambarus clarkii TaxID=6728 RepID=UPI003743A124